MGLGNALAGAGRKLLMFKEIYSLGFCDWKRFEQIRGAERPGMQSQPGAANLIKPRGELNRPVQLCYGDRPVQLCYGD
jgi:hypothetical protein